MFLALFIPIPFLPRFLDCFLFRPVAHHNTSKLRERKKKIRRKTADERHRISTHPNVNFTVVINPGNGPGPDSLPDGNYTREIPKLTAYDNVRVLGYVHTSYGKRNFSAVRKDIQTYADWPTNSSNPNLAVRGIFFDETPQQYDAQTLTYLQGLTDFAKNLKGLGPDQFVSSAILPKPCFNLTPYSLLYVYHTSLCLASSWTYFLVFYFILSCFLFLFPSVC
jgi:hypothetical protein